jgi:hypothetical protein
MMCLNKKGIFNVVLLVGALFCLSGCAAALAGIFAQSQTETAYDDPVPKPMEHSGSHTTIAEMDAQPSHHARDDFEYLIPFEAQNDGSLGSLGLNLGEYLSPEGQTLSDKERILRLESALLALHQDLKSIAPDLQSNLAGKHGAMDVGVPAAKTMHKKPTVKKAVSHTKPMKVGNGVYGIRFGEQSGSTRMVLDLSGPAEYSYDLDTTENLLVLEIQNHKWTARPSSNLKKSKYVVSYTASDIGGGSGSRVIVQLKNNPRIIKELSLKPAHGKPHRLVLDFGL